MVDAVAAVVAFAVATRMNRRLQLTLALSTIAAVAGFVVVSAPDLLEQLLIEGFWLAACRPPSRTHYINDRPWTFPASQ
ncbi:MAG: hypothetical protein JWO67_4060 [Streptosporangiaceae bacterium]|jgi:hypothetical protein|nr:hypothetical protein [Streptosporangiaceae bacterium]